MLSDDHIFKQRTLLKDFSPPKASIFVQGLFFFFFWQESPRSFVIEKNWVTQKLKPKHLLVKSAASQLLTLHIQDKAQILTAQTLQFLHEHLNWENQPFSLEAHMENLACSAILQFHLKKVFSLSWHCFVCSEEVWQNSQSTLQFLKIMLISIQSQTDRK